jgi:hypothetical protein
MSDAFLRNTQYAIIVRTAKAIGSKRGGVKLKFEGKTVNATKWSMSKTPIRTQKGTQTNFFCVSSFLRLVKIPATIVREKRAIVKM